MATPPEGERLEAEAGALEGMHASGDSAGAPVLEVRGLRKAYGRRQALAGVDFEARAGELVACIGPNGAGKTTLLSILAGVKEPDAGTVHRRAERVGWVPQHEALYGKLSAAENLQLF